jgi:hypothetical protein
VEAIRSFQTVLKLDPPDRADVHYRLARLFQKQKDPEARRQVLLALEEAPRFRAAHALFLQIAENSGTDASQEAAATQRSATPSRKE